MKKSPAKLKLKDAKKAVRKGKMNPDQAFNKGLRGKNYDKLVKSRAYKKQRADEAGYKSVRKAKKAAKANDGFLPDSPTMRKLSASCKAAARRKFDVYPSAYANMWASKRQRQGKC